MEEEGNELQKGRGEVEQQIDKEEKPSHHCLITDPSVIDGEDGSIHPFSIYLAFIQHVQ